MAVILQVTSGPHSGRKTFLRPGQLLKVGRTEWAEFSLPKDSELAEVHFALESGYGNCRIRDLSGGLTTLVNDKPVTEADVLHGDKITAGGSVFVLQIEEAARVAVPGPSGAGPAAATGGAKVASGFAAIPTPLAAEVCGRFELDAPARDLVQPAHTVRQFFELLAERGLVVDASRFLAHALPKREAVWWACICMRQAAGAALSAKDSTALSAAERWVLDPTEERRREAQPAAEATNYTTAAGWAAGAAFWSGGSVTPPNMPVVPPKETLTAQAIGVVFSLTAAAAGGAKRLPTFAGFLALGRDVADAKNRWPEAEKK